MGVEPTLETESLASTKIAALILCVCLLFFHAVRRRYGQGLNKFDGPFLSSFTDFWKLLLVSSNRSRIITADLHERYGDIVRLGPRKLSFGDPRALKEIYGINKGFVKSHFYSVSAGVSKGTAVLSLFSILNESYHAKLRRAVNNIFALSTLVQYEPFVNSTINVFLEQVEKRFADKEGPEGVVNLPLWLQYYAFDVIGELTYSARYGFLERGEDVDGIIEYLNKYMKYLSVIGQLPVLDKLFWKNPVVMWLSRYGLYDNSFPAVPFAQKAMRQRVEAKTEGRIQRAQGDFLEKFLQAKALHPDVVSDREVLAMALTMIFAGSETTAVSLSGIFYYLLKNPRCIDNLLEEFDTLLPKVESDAGYFEAWFSEIQKLPYLDACVKEAFRMHPAPGFDMERIVPAEGATICGERIPGGTTVSCNAWVIHRSKTIFGEDVDVYRPERWLEDPERAKVMASTLFQFGQGARTCIGKNISTLEMYKLIPPVFKTFEVTLDDPDAEWELHNDTFVKPTNFNVRIKRRRKVA